MHSATKFTPFEVVYGFNPLTLLDLTSLPIAECVDLDSAKKAEFVKILHEKTWLNIELKTEQYAKQANKERKKSNICAWRLGLGSYAHKAFSQTATL